MIFGPNHLWCSFDNLTTCSIITVMKKEKPIDPVLDKFIVEFTYAQAEALAAVFRGADVPPAKWSNLASMFAKVFQKAMNEATREKNGTVQKGEG